MNKVVDFVKVETRDIKWAFDNIRDNVLYVDNSFQRQFIWLKKHQISLIETVLKSMPMPEIYLWQQERDPSTGATKFSIIDGQQRLTTIYNFINNEFKLDKNIIEDTNASYAGKSFSELSNDDKSNIWGYNLSIRFVKEEISKEEIVKMFLRLNNTSMSLNPQELRNAEFQGKFIQLAGEISEFPFWTNYSIFSPNQVRRMIDIQFISSILIFIRRGIEEETTQENINAVYDLFNEEYEQAESDKALFGEILQNIEKIIQLTDVNIASFLKRLTHLYSLIVFMYYLKARNVQIDNSLAEKYGRFVEAYRDDTNQKTIQYFGEQYISYIEKYRDLSRKDTQAKQNRMERASILKSIMQ